MEGDRSVLRALCAETRDSDTVLLSTELIGCLSRSELEALRRLFPGATFEIIAVMRRLPSHWPSHWRELIKHGLATPFQSYLSEVLSYDPVTLSSPIRPVRLLQDLASVFGRESLKLLIFEAREHGAEYGVTFARDALGLKDATAFSTQSPNQMPAAWKVELGRIFNIFGTGWVDHRGRKAIFSALLGKLTYVEPNWIDDFRALLDAVAPTVLTEQTSLVADEQARVVGLFGDRFIDPVEAHAVPIRTEVRCVAVADLPAPLEIEMRKEFRAFRMRHTKTRNPEEALELAHSP